MAEIGLFPLGVALLPGELLPLHIFEPRYRELIGECLSAPAPFGLLFADESGMRSVGTEARIDRVLERFDDGRLNILILGTERFRVVRLTQGRSFHTAEIEAFSDEPDPGPPQSLEAAVSAAARIAAASDLETNLDLGKVRSAFELAALVPLPQEIKQELIESRSESGRVGRLEPVLESFAEALERRNEIRIRAASNGRAELG